VPRNLATNMASVVFQHMLKQEAFFMLGPEKARLLRENPSKIIFKYNGDGSPLSLSVLLPRDPNLIPTITQRSLMIKEKVDAEPYATNYPHRNRAVTIAKMFILTEEDPSSDVQITFLACTLSHFNHFFDRTPSRDWLDV